MPEVSLLETRNIEGHISIYWNIYNFQQRMSWLPQRWRTQRNAIRNTKRRTSWIIKILNANCASRKCLVAHLAECLLTSLNHILCVLEYGIDFHYWLQEGSLYWNANICRETHVENDIVWHLYLIRLALCYHTVTWNHRTYFSNTEYPLYRDIMYLA